MANPAKKLLRSTVERGRLLVHRAGFDVRRDSFKHRFAHALLQHGVTDVLDIGANTGQFARDIRRAGIAGRIVSLEPLQAAYDELRRHAAADPAWVAERAAVSDRPGTITMNVSANSVSSSVLPMLDRHAGAAPDSRYVATEEVTATTVDELVERHGLRPRSTLLKIDVQGHEQAVLDGAIGTLAEFGAVRTELSLVPLYDGQALLPDVLEHLGQRGFDLWAIEPGFEEPGTRRLLQADGFFLNRALG